MCVQVGEFLSGIAVADEWAGGNERMKWGVPHVHQQVLFLFLKY